MPNDFVALTNTDAVQGDAVRISAQGDALDAQAQARLGEIEGIEAGTPWGTDKYGVAFLSGYDQDPGKTGQGASASVKESLADLGQNAAKIGDAVTRAVLDYTGADQANTRGINSVRE